MNSSGKPAWAFVLPWELTDQGGVNQVVLNLLEQCRRSGRFEPLLIENLWNYPQPLECERLGFRCVCVRIRGPFNPPNPGLDAVKYLLQRSSGQRLVEDLCQRYGIAVFNPHFAEQSAWGLTGSAAKLVLSFHGSDIRNAHQAAPLPQVAYRRLLLRADAVVACSRGLLSEITELEPSLQNTAVIYNGFEPKPADNETKPIRARTDAPLIVTIGRFEYRKGHDILLDAFERLRQRLPDAQLWIIGGAGDTFVQTERSIRDRGLKNAVSLLTNLPHAVVAPTIKQADAFVLSSRWIRGKLGEGFPLAILEAGGLGLPVVSTRCCGADEIIEHERNGLLVDLDDVGSLARAMERVLMDRQLACDLGLALRDKVQTQYPWESAWKAYEGLF